MAPMFHLRIKIVTKALHS